MDDGPGTDNRVGLGEEAIVWDCKRALREARSSSTKSFI